MEMQDGEMWLTVRTAEADEETGGLKLPSTIK